MTLYSQGELKRKCPKNEHLFDLRHFIRHGSNFSAVFATASYQSVRVWSLTKKQELLRIIVPNFTATAVLFAYDGRSILTAWDDGVIRAFTPLTGKLMYAIPNAHNKGYFQLLHIGFPNLGLPSNQLFYRK